MGTLYRHRCPSCDYAVAVSGGPDAGMIATTTTVTCQVCRRLYDVPTAQQDLKTGEWRQLSLRCPRSSHHAVTEWTAGGPCPRCGTAMEQEESTLLWD